MTPGLQSKVETPAVCLDAGVWLSRGGGIKQQVRRREAIHHVKEKSTAASLGEGEG